MKVRPVQTDPFERIIGSSEAAGTIRGFGRRAAQVDAPVLLLGESGTGKGVLARAIHEASARGRQPFVSVNCAAVPETLFESEFFGHVRGAFTGAQYAHKGLFEQAEKGTLFLDEVGELPLAMQAKLLTTVEDRLIRRLGGERVAQLNVRVIAATARDLAGDVVMGDFRADLYHRLSVLSFRIPPLRERAGDVHELAHLFLHLHCLRYERGACVFDPAAIEFLSEHAWPGNIRELSNVIESAVLNSSGASVSIDAGSLQLPLRAHAAEPPQDERSRIAHALERAGGNRSRAARELGISRTTLWQKLRALDIGSGQNEQP